MVRGFQASGGGRAVGAHYFWDTTARVPPVLKAHFHSCVSRGSKIREPEYLGVMFASEIVDPAEDRHVWIDFVFGGEIHEIVIFDIEIRRTESQFLARVDPFHLEGRA